MGGKTSKIVRRKRQLEEPKTTGRFEVRAMGNGFHTDCRVENSDFELVVAEPAEKGGSGKGPNPMQYLVVSLTSCHQETAAVIAKEKGIKKWGPVTFHTKFELNTDGFLGLAKKSLPAYNVFRHVLLDAEVVADVDQSIIDEVYEGVKSRCPIRALFESAGVIIEGEWRKNVDIMENS